MPAANTVEALLELAASVGETPDQLVAAIRKVERDSIIAAAKTTIPVQTLPDADFTVLVSRMLDGESVCGIQDAYRALLSAMRRGDQPESWAALLVFLKAFRYEHTHWEHEQAVPAPVPPPAPDEQETISERTASQAETPIP